MFQYLFLACSIHFIEFKFLTITLKNLILYAEHTNYAKNIAGGTITNGDTVAAAGIGLGTTDLDGRYFRNDAYTIANANATAFTAKATGSVTGGTSGDNMAGVNVTIDQLGNIVETGY